MSYSKDIIRLSDRLDSIGLHKEADFSDEILSLSNMKEKSLAKKNLIVLADHLDKNGFHKESDYIDIVLKKYAFDLSDIGDLGDDIMEIGGDVLDFAGGVATGGIPYAVREIKSKLIGMAMGTLGIEEGSVAADFVKNLLAGLTWSDIQKMTGGDEKCKAISEEVVNALQKTALDQILTVQFVERVEKSIENSVKSLFGLEEGGWADTSMGKVIQAEQIRNMLTYYITDNNIISDKISDLLCEWAADFNMSDYISGGDILEWAGDIGESVVDWASDNPIAAALGFAARRHPAIAGGTILSTLID